MSVDKLVDSTQLDTDLTSVANAIRTKGGTSAQLAFPTDFVSAINAISGGTAGTFVLSDYVIPSSKWVAQNSIPNVLSDGGCIHIILNLQTNTSTSEDKQIIGFGIGALNNWNPGTTNPSAYLNVSKNSNSTNLYLRGAGNTSLGISSRADGNGKVDLKLYSDHLVNVNTGVSSSYGTAIQEFFTAISAKSYIGVGINQSNPFAGAVLALFALEEA